MKDGPPPQQWFWIAGLLFILALIITDMLQTRPNDVLNEVMQLRSEVRERTSDRFYRSEFEAFLKRNPQLNP